MINRNPLLALFSAVAALAAPASAQMLSHLDGAQHAKSCAIDAVTSAAGDNKVDPPKKEKSQTVIRAVKNGVGPEISIAKDKVTIRYHKGDDAAETQLDLKNHSNKSPVIIQTGKSSDTESDESEHVTGMVRAFNRCLNPGSIIP